MKRARAEHVQSMDVVLTAACNLRCSYCYQNTKNPARMRWETLRRSIDLLARSEQEEVSLTFYGGEPLLQLDLIRRAVEYADALPPGGPRIGYAIITNGLLIRPGVADFLARNDFSTRISFDGVPRVQDERGRGTFRKLDALLDRLRADHPGFYRDRINISMTCMSATLPYLAESFAYMLSKGVAEVHLSTVDTHDAGWKPEMFELLDDQFRRIHDLSLDHYRRTAEIPLAIFRHGEPGVHAPAKLGMCGVTRGETLTVDVDGEVSGCVVFARSYQSYPTAFLEGQVAGLRMGDVGADDLDERLAIYPEAASRSAIFHDKQDKYSSYGACGSCDYLEECEVCPVSIGYVPGNTDPRRVPDHLCAFNMVSRKWRGRFPAQPDTVTGLLGGELPGPLERFRTWLDA